MASLKVWNASGVLILDLTDRITRYLGTFNVTTANTGTFTDSRLIGGAAWFHINNAFRAPRITFNATLGRFSWDWETIPASYRGARSVRFGLY
jgi:hypothetical protein